MKGIFVKRIIVTLMLLLFTSGCVPRHKSKRYNKKSFPIEDISFLLDMETKDFHMVSEANRYIFLDNYDFYIINYLRDESLTGFSLAASKDMSIIYYLNYPERFSFVNFNKIILTERYRITDESNAVIYLKFMTKLFMQDTKDFDEFKREMANSTMSKDTNLLKFVEEYETVVKFDSELMTKIDAVFYTFNNSSIMYRWQIRMKKNGMVTYCRITMMALSPDYQIQEQAVIFNKVIDMTPKRVVDDPSFNSP